MTPDCTNYWNRIAAEKSYLLDEAGPDFQHKGRLLQPFLVEANDLAKWWVRLAEAAQAWIQYATAIKLPDHE
jgi:hypothetical protein